MNTSTEIESQDRTGEAVALIDAWLSEHSWWADSRAIDFASTSGRYLPIVSNPRTTVAAAAAAN